MTTHRKFLIVCYTGQGHISPALQFATRLVKLGVNDVTLCANVSSIRRIDKETTPHGITFAPFSDGHDDGVQPTTTLEQFVSDHETNGVSAVAELISSAKAAGKPFEHLVFTTAVPWAARVANAHGTKSTLLWCQSATILDIYYYYANGYQNLISRNNDNPKFPIILPGLPSLTIDDLSSFMMSSCPTEHNFILPGMLDHIHVLEISPKVLVNTFDELEYESIRATKKLELIPIGPLVSLEFLEGKDLDNYSDRPKDDYIQWLNTKAESSVVYVSFGTVAIFSMEQLEEVANGLLESGKSFLWVIRDGEKAKRLSKLEELEKLGMIVGWCAQMVVLRHKSIGCFVTHGGWNSALESLVAAVPTVVYPQWSDQPNDAKMIQDVWKTGVRVKTREGDGMLEAKEIQRCVDMVMGNENMKRNAEKWSALAREAQRDGGSSTVNLQAFLENA
uniref:phloretin 4'-O-glucosyltransferase-like n=1 Tax=Erigeron canadensis TaxID=72917 RepID=UPI001CB9D71B|nr:phloretin 4'-O-glucosyltransferase-like [Erigeron canadensis]